MTTKTEYENNKERRIQIKRRKGLQNSGAFVVSIVVLICTLVLSSLALAADNQLPQCKTKVGTISVEVDPRVELISIVFRLAGNPEYNDGTLRPYVKAIEKQPASAARLARLWKALSRIRPAGGFETVAARTSQTPSSAPTTEQHASIRKPRVVWWIAVTR